ncbi:protein kinase [Streptomyces roseoverticillatus]|uniref:serine/threonine-protein kinase n=1 Tax=Streptomyces roseoverticillatus TaxID=66429 RepID=UPI001F2B0546|nr:serine/threonine-protein kinase [Streptomyces roseoverticillatus]MCF3105670.1 protein kinase [Streptomyces roseoverticillatus]
MLEPLTGPPREAGPYRLLGMLGAGGMGEVYLARRTDGAAASGLVAVKTVRQDLDLTSEFRARFRREIDAARAVRSPYAAALVDGDADAALPWLATEYVAGPSLAEAVARTGPLPAGAVRTLGAGLARALADVHAARVLHRDLKPGNVLLAADGPRLIDFGIAQAFDATALTTTGLIVGTPGFMAPEHLEGSRAVVAATDVFCLGAVLCFAATGRGPFDDDELGAVVYRISRAEADPATLAALPGGLRETVTACLALEPADRPTPQELIGLLSGEPCAWPDGVRALIAGHEAAAVAVRAEAGSAPPGAAVAADHHGGGGPSAGAAASAPQRPAHPPAVPHVPTRLGYAPAAPVQPAPRRSRRKAVLAGAAAFLAAAAIGAAVAFPQLTGGKGAPEDAAAAEAAPTAAGAKAARVVLPYGNAGHSGEFGQAAQDRSARPAGWAPWNTRLDAGATACALSGPVLVCGTAAGGAAGLDAATGKRLWSIPAEGGAKAAVPAPAVADGIAYVPQGRGITAVDSAGGRPRWSVAAPAGTFLSSMELSGGVLYAVWSADGDEPGTRMTAHRADAGHQQLWQTEQKTDLGGTLLVHGDRLYLSSMTTTYAFGTRDGKEAARRPGLMCAMSLAYKDALLCTLNGDLGVKVLDARTLEPRTVLAPDVRVRAAPAVGDRGVLVVQGDRELAGYDFASGERLWAEALKDSLPVLGGDRALIVTDDQLYAYALDRGAQLGQGKRYGGHDWSRSRRVPQALAVGQAVFLAYPDGTVISGYAP